VPKGWEILLTVSGLKGLYHLELGLTYGGGSAGDCKRRGFKTWKLNIGADIKF